MKRANIIVLLATTVLVFSCTQNEPENMTITRVEKNVRYDTYHGLSLLMDVHYPPEPNGHGIILIWGCAWYGLEGTGGLLTDLGAKQIFLDCGYTVFVVNHRGYPGFTFPAAVEDVQQAVRFIRYNAVHYGIDPNLLGGWGHSSGAHLVALLATMDGTGNPDDLDRVNHESAKLQAVVTVATPTDLSLVDTPVGIRAVMAFLDSPENKNDNIYREASPVTHVTPDDPPFMIIHGEEDKLVPFHQSELMYEVLVNSGIDARLIRLPGRGHNAWDDVAAVRWFNRFFLEKNRVEELEPLLNAHTRLWDGRRLARDGKISDAIEAFREAEELDARLTMTIDDWNLLCRQGGCWGQPADVLFACEQAIEMGPKWGPPYHISRGIVRALLGDTEGAIEDIEFAIEGEYLHKDWQARHQSWIDSLQAGKNPFTPEVLEQLRK